MPETVLLLQTRRWRELLLEKRPRGRPSKPRFRSTDFALKPKGVEGGPKRTPQHIGDPYANFESYEVEDIIAQCLKQGIEHFKVRIVLFGLIYPSMPSIA